MAALALNSKTITVTLPGDLARKLEILAEREGRDASDIVAEAVQALWADRVDKLFAETRTYAATRNPHGYTETDVPRLIREVREDADACDHRGLPRLSTGRCTSGAASQRW